MLDPITHVSEVEAALDACTDHTLEFDPWGFSPKESKLYYSLAYWIYRYFRPIVRGTEHVPDGRVLLVANHSGQLPFDGIAIAMAMLLETKKPRILRGMVERWVPSLPFVNVAFSRAGVVLGDPMNCRNLLEAEQAILVFPEGVRGISKPWNERYQLAPFGRGFMRLALQTNAPIVPISVVGAEEAIISVYNAKTLAKRIGMPALPVPLLLPLLGPFAFFPLPTRFYLQFGEPLHFSGPFDDEDEAIDEKVRVVEHRIQTMIRDGLTERKSLFG